MEIRFTKRDCEIAIGMDELKQITKSDIQAAYRDLSGLRVPSQRTTELYGAIIEAVEDQAKAEQKDSC